MDLNSFKDPVRMGKTPKFVFMIIVLIAAIAAGYALDTSGQIKQLQDLQGKEQDLRTTFLDRKKQAVNLAAHKEQLKEIEIAFGTLLRQLPNKSEMDALLNDVNQAGVGRGLSFDLFKPVPVEIVTEFYAEQPVNISVSGNYSEFGQFAEDVSRLSRIVNMDEIQIKTKNDTVAILGGAPPALSLDAVVRTYRYLDEQEIAARRAGAKKPAAKPGAKPAPPAPAK